MRGGFAPVTSFVRPPGSPLRSGGCLWVPKQSFSYETTQAPMSILHGFAGKASGVDNFQAHNIEVQTPAPRTAYDTTTVLL